MAADAQSNPAKAPACSAETPDGSATGAPAPNTLSQRYGRSNTPRRYVSTRTWVYLALAVTVLAGMFVLWIQVDAASRPSARDTGFTLISANEVTGEFELSKNPQDTAICSVKALNSSRVPVGWVEVEIGPNSPQQGAERVTRHSVNLRVLSAATTVTIESCRLK